MSGSKRWIVGMVAGSKPVAVATENAPNTEPPQYADFRIDRDIMA
jgi:hypothetical protein